MFKIGGVAIRPSQALESRGNKEFPLPEMSTIGICRFT
jgi:hypothetical protein